MTDEDAPLDEAELEDEQAELLPEREAMSVITPDLDQPLLYGTEEGPLRGPMPD